MGKRSKERKAAKAKALLKSAKRKADDSDDSSEEEQRIVKKSKNENSSLFTVAAKALAAPTFEGIIPCRKQFWTGEDPGPVPSQELKELRKSMGILVKGSVHLCPAPLASLDAPFVPASFQKVFSQLGLSVPSTVQSQAWSAVLFGANVTCIAPTGSGKTLAYGLPMIPHIEASRLTALQRKVTRHAGPMAVVLVPTRELAIQVANDLKSLNKLFNIRSIAVYGGQDKAIQLEAMEGVGGCPSIIVATPGRLLDFITKKEISMKEVTYLVLDEADRMLALGFAEQLDAIASQLRPDRQTLLFSATFPGKLREVSERWLGLESVVIRCGTVEVGGQTPTSGGAISGSGSSSGGVQSRDMSVADNCKHDGNPTASEDSIEEPNKNDVLVAMASPHNEQTAVNAGNSTAQSLISTLAINHNIIQTVHVCAEHKKPRLLIHYIERARAKEKLENIRQPGAMLIFCTKIKTVMFVFDFLVKQSAGRLSNSKIMEERAKQPANKKAGDVEGNKYKEVASVKGRDATANAEKVGVGMLHGQMSQADRDRTMTLFKAGKLSILVATDVASRGIHVKRLDYVINYDFPSSLEQYCHRIGRTGRRQYHETASVVAAAAAAAASSSSSSSSSSTSSQSRGNAYSLLTRNMAPLSRDLIELMKICGQQIEPNLQKLADSLLESADSDDEQQEDNNNNDDDNDSDEGNDDDEGGDNNSGEDNNNDGDE